MPRRIVVAVRMCFFMGDQLLSTERWMVRRDCRLVPTVHAHTRRSTPQVLVSPCCAPTVYSDPLGPVGQPPDRCHVIKETT